MIADHRVERDLEFRKDPSEFAIPLVIALIYEIASQNAEFRVRMILVNALDTGLQSLTGNEVVQPVSGRHNVRVSDLNELHADVLLRRFRLSAPE
jgi:hypothetical protein